jgi:uncharacterized membrane protein
MTTRTLILEPERYHEPEYETAKINISWPERYTSIIAGAKLGYSGLKNIFNSPFMSIAKIGASGYLINRGITGHCGLYDVITKITENSVNINIRSSFIIHKPRHEVYDFWRRLDNLPLFMTHLKSVTLMDNDHSHWILKMPKGVPNLSWDAEIVKDKPDEMIGWHSVPGSIIVNAGKVRFRDGITGEGTRVDIVITYQPPVGTIGARLARVFTPMFKKMVEKDVRNFKHFMDIDYATEELNYL